MKKLVLSYNQSKKVMWQNETIRVSRNGEVLYISHNGDEVVAKTWLGSKVELNVVVDECFQ